MKPGSLQKYFEPSLNLVQSLCGKPFKGQLKFTTKNAEEIYASGNLELKITEFHLSCEISSAPFHQLVRMDEVGNQADLFVGDSKIRLRNVFWTNHVVGVSLHGEVRQITMGDFIKRGKRYRRLVIPIKNRLRFHYILEQSRFSSERLYSSACCALVQFSDRTVFFCEIEQDGQRFACIDSHDQMSQTEFEDLAFSFIVTYGYISGWLLGDMGFYLSFDRLMMKKPNGLMFRKLRPEINGFYRPFTENPYSILHSKSKIADSYWGKLREMTQAEFGRLCELAHESIEFQSLLLLIIEAMDSSLLIMPRCLCVALESLVHLIKEGIVGQEYLKAGKINFKDKKMTLISRLLEVVDNNVDGNSADYVKTAKSRIEGLNNPPNHLKLKHPFDRLSIVTSDEDVSIFKLRNQLLHGMFPNIVTHGEQKKRSKSDEVDEINRSLYYASMRLYTLLNLGILSLVDFDGRIINYSKTAEKGIGIKLKESHFRSKREY